MPAAPRPPAPAPAPPPPLLPFLLLALAWGSPSLAPPRIGAQATRTEPSTAPGRRQGSPAAPRQESAIMSKQEAMERLDTETRTSNSHTYNTDAFHTFGSGKGRTLRTIANSAPASIAVTGSSTSHTEMIRSGHLTHHSSSVMRIRRTDEASPNTVDTAKFETVTLRISSPKIPVASISEVNHPATESSHHMDSHWKADSTTSDLQNKNRNSSNTTNSAVEGPSLFLTENITVADPVSQREITSSTVHSQFPSQATHSRRKSSTKDATQLAGSSEGTVLNHSYFYSKTSMPF